MHTLGVTHQHLAHLKIWSRTNNVTLMFTSSETYKFLRKQTRVIENSKNGGADMRTVEYVWELGVVWKLLGFSGTSVDAGIVVVMCEHERVSVCT